MAGWVEIASGLDRDSLERLSTYLRHHGIQGSLENVSPDSSRLSLRVDSALADQARRVMESIVLAGGDVEAASEVIEIDFSVEEKSEVAAWLELLMEDHDDEGSPIWFYRGQYEQILDAMQQEMPIEFPVFLLASLKPFLPEGARRLIMSPILRQFFELIEMVANPDGEG